MAEASELVAGVLLRFWSSLDGELQAHGYGQEGQEEADS
jgi:hypothetical protein